MIIGGFSHAGTFARPGAGSASAHSLPGPLDRGSDRDGSAPDERPTYFRTISAISPGSLAAVYQAMKAHEAAMGPEAKTEVQTVKAAGTDGQAAEEASILSGLGIPAAMSAYGEAIEPADE